ncbi:PREDICTED: uncharacterized protein LOC109583222 [Amphimedon queenslandica]|uniref:Uncharacterized protein n=1 Tax=Amphimedon queenslandica TaxID=400682 RepID=A0A1X7UIB0_AMPQE|nr:PREDICTED: uncharacterized protein LOC109583222 [Amphimedon queenslandica]|eukprot:XP_019854032.1 PREDICTED: uncharacterized protein LOC109583222 [Amphimedon queenslandica]
MPTGDNTGTMAQSLTEEDPIFKPGGGGGRGESHRNRSNSLPKISRPHSSIARPRTASNKTGKGASNGSNEGGGGGQRVKEDGGMLPLIQDRGDRKGREERSHTADLRSASSRAASKSFWNMSMLHEREKGTDIQSDRTPPTSPDKTRRYQNRAQSLPMEVPLKPHSLESRPVILGTCTCISPSKGEEPRIRVHSMETRPRPKLNGLYGLPKGHRRRAATLNAIRKTSSFEK